MAAKKAQADTKSKAQRQLESEKANFEAEMRRYTEKVDHAKALIAEGEEEWERLDMLRLGGRQRWKHKLFAMRADLKRLERTKPKEASNDGVSDIPA